MQLPGDDHAARIWLLPPSGRVGLENPAQPLGNRPRRPLPRLPQGLGLRYWQSDIDEIIRVLAELQPLKENRGVVTPANSWHTAYGIVVRRDLTLGDCNGRQRGKGRHQLA